MRPQPPNDNNHSRFLDIREFKLLSSIGEHEMTRVVGTTKLAGFVRDEFIYLSGDPATKIYFVKEGRVRVSALTEDGREVLLDIIGPGEIFGEIGILQGPTRTNSAQALESSLLYEMCRADFEDLLNRHPRVCLHMARCIGLRLKRYEGRVVNLIGKDVYSRVKEVLTDLVCRTQATGGRQSTKISLTQQDIANLVGASLQETARVLRELERIDVVELRYRAIIVKAPERLQSATSSDDRRSLELQIAEARAL